MVSKLRIAFSLSAGLIAPSLAAQSDLWVTNSASGSVSRIDAVSGSVTATVPTGSSPVDLAFHPDGSKLYVANFRSANVAVIDVVRATRTATIAVGDYPAGVGVTPDGSTLLVVRDYSGSLLLIDTTTHAVRATIPIVRSFSGGVGSVVFAPDGRSAYVISGAVAVLDLETMSISTTFGAGYSVGSAAITPDGRNIWFVDGWTGIVTGFETLTHTTIGSIQVGSLPREIAIGIDGRTAFVTVPAYLAMSNGVGAPAPLRLLSVLDLASLQVLRSITTAAPPIGVTRSLDGSRFYVSLMAADQVVEYDAVTHAPIAQYGAGRSPGSLAVRPATARNRNYGVPCSSSLGSVVAAAASAPWLGSEWSIAFENVPATAALIGGVGFGSQSIPLASLVPGGVPGCDLLIDLSIALPAQRTSNGDSLALTLPRLSELIGARAFVQAIVIDGPSVYGSDAVEGTFGMR